MNPDVWLAFCVGAAAGFVAAMLIYIALAE